MAEVSNRKIQWITSSFFVLLYFCSLPAQAQYGGGTGEPNDPYLIYTPEQMNEIGSNPSDWHKHFKLMVDINLSIYTGTDFNIIGDADKPFTGVFDGNSHTISQFNYTSTNKDCIGLFGYVYPEWGHEVKIRDLGLINPNIDAGTGNYVGPLIGILTGGSVNRCYVEGGNAIGNESVGGLVGTHHYTLGYGSMGLPPYTISNSYSTCSVEGNSNVGGLVGSNTGQIINCYAMGSVSGKEIVGGLVGQNGSGRSDPWWPDPNGIKNILYCYSTGHVSGKSDTGGLVGLNADGIIIDNSFWDMQTSRQAISAGGIDKFTTDMQTADTFLEAGWDFIGETENDTEDIWWILEGQDYPRLWWQYGQAFSPYPQDRAVDIPQPLILSWLPGGSSLQHDVYFSEDKEAVANAKVDTLGVYRGRQEPEMITYNPGNLELEKTYYWRIDEVNEDDPNSPWKGHVWSFTTVNYIVVDDFESYDAADNQIWFSWLDGLGYGMFGAERYYPGNGTGSCVGEIDWIEETIVHSGSQSMTYYYDNNRPSCFKYSEAEKTLSYPRNWTEDGVSELSLWFRGRPADVGSFVEGPIGTYTMTGSGTDLNSWNNQFHFAFKTLTGPGSIVAKVESIEYTHEWAKAGVMIREELYGYSKHAFVYVTPGNGIAFQGREYGGTSFSTNQTGITAPHWIKLERDAANNFTAYHSSDGSEWEAIGEMQNIQMDTNIYVGFALTSHDSSVACEAKFSNVTMTGVVGEQWAHQDIGMITNDIEPMYIVIANNTGKPVVVYHNYPGAAGINTWTEWLISLQRFADLGIDLTDVNSIAIGFGDRNNPQPGGSGKMWFDDIRLYRPRPAASNDLEVNVP